MSPAIIFHYFDTLSDRQKKQFHQIGPIYKSWNQKLNLVSRNDINHIYLKHVLHALSIAKAVAFKPNTKILDVGTGGGFPGIPLAILFPKARFHLIDSIGKKIRAVRYIAEALELSNVVTDQVRAENVEEQYDFVLGRAVTNLVAFCSWVKDNVSCYHQHGIPNGILYLQGPERVTLPMKHATYTIRDFFDDPFFETKQLVHIMSQSY